MPSLDIDTALSWRGRTVIDRDGDKIGKLGEVFLDRKTQMPAWAGVRTGLFGRRETYVPLSSVEEVGEEELRVPFEAEHVKAAPQIDPEIALAPGEEQALFEHYGATYEAYDDEPDAPQAPPAEADGAPPAVHETGGAAETVRSEEEVHVEDGPMRPAERVRLKKVTVTEHEKRVVPVQREVVEVVEDDGLPPR